MNSRIVVVAGIVGALIFAVTPWLSVAGASGSAVVDDDPKGKPKGVYHDTMEEIEDLYVKIKNARTEVEQFPDLVKSARQMQPLFEKVIPMTTKRLQELGTAKTEVQFLEAKSMLVECLAHCIGLEAALLKGDADAVKARLRKLNSVKNAAHREFQP